MRFAAKAETLRQKHEQIVSVWEARVRREMPQTRDLSQVALRNHVPVLLEELAAALEGRGRENAAAIHGRHRAEQDFDIREALRDLAILREVTVDALDGDPGDRGLRGEVHAFFDRAMQDAAGSLSDRAADARTAENEFRDRILSILSHDLRNPLSAISVGTELILLDATLRPTSRRAAERVSSSAARMARMIRDLLDFGRSQRAAALRMERAPCDAAAIALEIVDELRTARPDRQIEVIADGPMEGVWDRDRLSQVFSNLIGNALEYGAPDQPVRVVLTHESVDGRPHLRADVHDRGQVIPEVERSAIFEAFRRGNDRPRGDGNLGLGLYIVREIVRAHQGTLTLTRSDEEDTVFTVRLPLEAGND